MSIRHTWIPALAACCLLAAPATARVGGSVADFQRDFTNELQMTLQEKRIKGLAAGFDTLLTYRGGRNTFLAAKLALFKGRIVSQSVLLGVMIGDREHEAQAVTVLARFYQEAMNLSDAEAYRITHALMKEVMGGKQRSVYTSGRVKLSLAGLPARVAAICGVMD